MLQTVLRIPHDVAGYPVFGWGWAVGVLALMLLGAILLAWLRPALSEEALGAIPTLLVMSAVAVWVMPFLEERGPNDMPMGLPIRGYGVMLVLAVVSGFALTLYRARRMGFDPERVMAMLIGMFVLGIIGARLFHVIQYWDVIHDGTSLTATLGRVFKFNEGGLVVYGSLIGGVLWVLYFTRREKWSLLATGDMVAPGMVLGLAIGRIGCLLNGCCHGGACTNEQMSMTFPKGSPPYMSQMETGELLGLRLEQDDRGLRVARVDEGPAKDAGVEPGGRVLVLSGEKDMRNAQVTGSNQAMVVIQTPRANARWSYADLPRRSLPTRPAQIYSAINAALLCLFLLAWHPYRSRQGELVLVMLTIYPITRFLLELVRTDEPGRFGTQLTIAQWVSCGILAAAIVGWIINLRMTPPLKAPAE